MKTHTQQLTEIAQMAQRQGFSKLAQFADSLATGKVELNAKSVTRLKALTDATKHDLLSVLFCHFCLNIPVESLPKQVNYWTTPTS